MDSFWMFPTVNGSNPFSAPYPDILTRLETTLRWARLTSSVTMLSVRQELVRQESGWHDRQPRHKPCGWKLMSTSQRLSILTWAKPLLWFLPGFSFFGELYHHFCLKKKWTSKENKSKNSYLNWSRDNFQTRIGNLPPKEIIHWIWFDPIVVFLKKSMFKKIIKKKKIWIRDSIYFFLFDSQVCIENRMQYSTGF